MSHIVTHIITQRDLGDEVSLHKYLSSLVIIGQHWSSPIIPRPRPRYYRYYRFNILNPTRTKLGYRVTGTISFEKKNVNIQCYWVHLLDRSFIMKFKFIYFCTVDRRRQARALKKLIFSHMCWCTFLLLTKPRIEKLLCKSFSFNLWIIIGFNHICEKVLKDETETFTHVLGTWMKDEDSQAS